MTAPDVATKTAVDVEALFHQLLTTDGLERALVWSTGREIPGIGWVTIIDRCDDPAVKVAYNWQQFWRHLITVDSGELIRTRGYRIHTVLNTELGALDDADCGPAFRTGP